MFAHGVVLSCSCSWFCNHNRLPFLVSVIKKDFVWCGSRFADLQPFRCHHECSLMVVRELLQVTIINASDYHKCKSFAHGVVPGGGRVPGGGHVDVIMNVRSWCGSQSFIHVDVINYSQL